MKRLSLVVLFAGAWFALSGCDFAGAHSLALPFTVGTGSGSDRVTVEIRSASNLVPNAEVKFADVTVGTVTDIRFKDWHAELTVSLRAGTSLPANVTATVGQKSLLGATYLRLVAPADGNAVGRLRNGDVIPMNLAGSYPDTEQFLTALSVVLNGGGLNQLKTINTELNLALDGHERDARTLIGNLQGLVGTLDSQRDQIVRTIDGLNQFAGQFAAQQNKVAAALDTIPQGFAVLNRNRNDFTTALQAIGDLDDVASRVINASRAHLLANLRDLQPTLDRLADSGKDLTESLSETLTFPWPSRTLGNAYKGDYGNLWITFDLTLDELQRNLLKGTPLEGLPPLGADKDATNPLRVPLLENVPPVAPANGPGLEPPASGSRTQPSSAPVPTRAPSDGLLWPVQPGGR